MKNMDNSEQNKTLKKYTFLQQLKLATYLLITPILTTSVLTGCSSSTSDTKTEDIKKKDTTFSDYYYAVYRKETQTIIYETVTDNDWYVTRYDGKSLKATRGFENLYDIYRDDRISKKDLLFREQTENMIMVVFIDFNGVASFYQNYQLIQKIDLVSKNALDISNEKETLVGNEDKLVDFSGQKRLVK